MGELVDLGAERAIRELAELVARRPDIGEAVRAAAAAEDASMGEAVALDFLTVEEAAERLRVQPVTIRAWIRQGRLPAFRAGRRVLVRPADLLALVEPLAPEALDADEETADLESRLFAWKADRHERAIFASIEGEGGHLPENALPDAVIKRIAARKPRSSIELRCVPGMGATRMDNFGKELLAILGVDDGE